MNYWELPQLIVNRIPMPFDKWRFEYEWPPGAKEAVIDVYTRLEDNITPGREFWLGNLNLICVDFDILSQCVTVALMDGRGYQAYLRRRFFYIYQNIVMRIVLTLYVWGLANYSQGEIIGWHNVHWGRRK